MNVKRLLLLVISHSAAVVIGFAAGIYTLPILAAPEAPSTAELSVQTAEAIFTGVFRRDLKDSDLLHWGDGIVAIGAKGISFVGSLAPGPDYKLYLAPEFIETEADFNRLKTSMVKVGDVKTFENFIVNLPATIDVKQYNTVIVWCEAFSQFITAAKYQE